MSGYSACFNEFWTQMVRWLVNQSDFLPGQDVSLKTDRASYTPEIPSTFLPSRVELQKHLFRQL